MQPKSKPAEKPNQEKKITAIKGTQTYLLRAVSSASIEVPYERGVAGTGQPTVRYAKLNFEPANMFAVGSPIGLFVTVRGVTSFGLDFKLPTCASFYNIFHPVSMIFIPKTLKIILTAFSSGARHMRMEWES